MNPNFIKDNAPMVSQHGKRFQSLQKQGENKLKPKEMSVYASQNDQNENNDELNIDKDSEFEPCTQCWKRCKLCGHLGK